MLVCASCGQENPDGFKFCGNCGAPLAAPAPAREQRKVVTIVFCDLTGSTALGDSTDPEALRATMRGYYDEMRTILERHGGTVEKFVGDAVMAVFGVPLSHEDDALRAVRAAWEMRTAVPALGLQARIGVNTGEVVTGEGETLVTGDAVNVAARLEQAAEPGHVLIGDATRRLVRDAARVEPITVTAKGKPEPLPAFRLLDLDPDASGVARRLDTALVGREHELDLLNRAFERTVSERSCQLFTLLGPAGVGKTRLTAEFLETVDATVATGRCLDYGDGITLWPVIGLLKQLGAEETIERITGTIPSTELLWTVRTELERHAQERPLIVVLEDIHWGEPTFLDLIDHVSDLTRGVPLMLLCVARPELLDERPGWGGGKLNATTTLLEPLSAAAAADLVDALGSDLDENVRSRVLAAAEGNPLFVEEMIALAREDGDDVRAPSTVQALLQARLDRLPQAQRSVMERGAVEGEIFHRLSVTELSGEPVDIELIGLVRKELIRPERGTIAGDEAYRFRHLLIRDAAYEALPKETRADLHERFARWVERQGGLVELDEIVGHHLEQAALYRRELGRPDVELDRAAAARLAAAGRAALRREDYGATNKLLGRAIALTPRGDPSRGPLLHTLASALISSRAKTLAPLIEELEHEADPVLAMSGRILREHYSFASGGYDRTEEVSQLARDAIELFAAAGYEAGLGDAWALLSLTNWMRCRAVETLGAAEHALAFRRKTGNPMFMWMIGPLGHGPFPPDEVRRRLAVLMENDTGRLVHGIERMIESGMLRREGRFEESLEAWAQGDALLAELGSGPAGFLREVADVEPAMIALARDDLEQAETILRKAYEALGSAEETAFRSTIAIQLGEIAYARGRPDEAEALALYGVELGGPDDLTNMVLGPALRAKIVCDRGDADAALALAEEAVSLSEGTDLPDMVGAAWDALGYVRRARGELGHARAAYEEELQVFETCGNIVSAGRVRRLLVEL